LGKFFGRAFEKEGALTVEVWDGKAWTKQGSLKAGMELWDDSLVTLNVQDIKSDELKIRLESISGFYQVDYAAVDYSEDELMEVQELNPYQSLLNDKETVSLEMNDGKYVTLKKGDKIDLTYKAVPEKSGWKRDYTVAIKGYYSFINYKNQTFFGFLKGVRDVMAMLLSKDGFAKSVASFANEK
jgi:hypothetical protein